MLCEAYKPDPYGTTFALGGRVSRCEGMGIALLTIRSRSLVSGSGGELVCMDCLQATQRRFLPLEIHWTFIDDLPSSFPKDV